MTKYVKLEDIKQIIKKYENRCNESCTDNYKIDNCCYKVADVSEDLNNLPTTEIKQDRLEVIKNNCEEKQCIRCSLEKENGECFMLDVIDIFTVCPRNWKFEGIDEAIAKIKESK